MAPKRKNKKSDEEDEDLKISVNIVTLPDEDISELLNALKQQTLSPHEIIVETEGTITQARNKAFQKAKGDIIAIIDSDEIPPPDWLEKLTAPIQKGIADFTVGPSYFPEDDKTLTEEFQKILHKNIYEHLKENLDYFPLQNTAWHRKVFDELEKKDGYVFDERLKYAEDWDISMRIKKYGFKGVYVEAPVTHIYKVQSLSKLLKKRFEYNTWAVVAYFKNGATINFKKTLWKKQKKPHILYFIENIFKPFAFIRGYVIWRKMVGKKNVT